MRDSSLQHSARVAALDAARTALEAKLRWTGMFRLEVRIHPVHLLQQRTLIAHMHSH